MKKAIAILATLAMALTSAPSASAHAQLQIGFPKPGSVAKIWPTQIWVEFDGDLIQLGGSKVNQLTIKDSAGKIVETKPSVVSGAQLSVETIKPAKSGKVSVMWRVVSEDGHPVSHSYTFFYIPKR